MSGVEMKHVKFEEKFEAFLNSLKCQERTSHIGLDEDYELSYMKGSRCRFKEIINSIPHSSDQIKILDIGTTPFTLFVKQVYPHYEVSTLDLTSLLEGQCKAMDIQFKTCDLEEQRIPFEDDYFDVVIFCEVLEHIFAPPTEILKEIRRTLRARGGKLILSVPNIAALYQRIRLLFGISPLANPDDQMKKGWVHGHGHLHEYTMKEITCLLEACNFTISNKKYLGADESKEKGILQLMRRIYDTVVFLIPPFRSTIYLECYKQIQIQNG